MDTATPTPALPRCGLRPAGEGAVRGFRRVLMVRLVFSEVIAIHRKFQTRRVAEDSTRLYGEATQHSMKLSVDGYTYRVAGIVYVKSPGKRGCIIKVTHVYRALVTGSCLSERKRFGSVS